MAFLDVLLAAANRPRQRATARLLAAIHAERRGDVEDAEQYLNEAHAAAPELEPVTDRLAWYAADRGDAARAVRLWRGLGLDQRSPELAEAQQHTGGAPGREPGRNEPCWCGSGRKYKQCHLGSTGLEPLPERVGWLCRKAISYLERRRDADDDVWVVAESLAADPDDRDSLVEVFADPLTLDLVLTEGGWFERFLAERGALLPDDEALLAQSWTLVDRTVYEVVETRPGEGLTMRDLRTGEALDVRERTLSHEVEEAMLLCARAVSDGQTHQFVGGLVGVPPGGERELLDVLDRGDPIEIAEYVWALRSPPTIEMSDRLNEFLEAGELAEAGGGAPSLGDVLAGLGDLDDVDPGQLDEALRDHFERQWCDERVPALDGLTPRQAAADPTRRDALLRLIASFEDVDAPDGAITMRPARLRELLDL
ncbi:MAG: SEC-C domain-containing protein [Acidimicrobiia bacterium]|nr:SEC-C domain-containing protein [Acidimicrobiia bacterium]